MVPTPSLVQLAERISRHAKELQTLLESKAHQQKSSPASNSKGIPTSAEDESVSQARLALIEANQAMMDVVLSPWDRLRLILDSGRTNIAVVQTVDRFDIAQLVPAEGSISFDDLANAAHVNQRLLERILRYGFTVGLFTEPQPGQVAHTSLSAVIPAMSPFIRLGTAEIVQQAFYKMPDALRIWSEPPEPGVRQIPLNLVVDNDLSYFENVLARGGSMKGFSDAMECLKGGGDMDPTFTVNGFDWAALGEGPVVDLGGGNGHISVAVAEAFPQLHIIVQDLPSNAEHAKATIPTDLQSRVTFQEHDFFQPQPQPPAPAADAEAYFTRMIFHDWPDEECVRIVQQLLPQLEKGKKLFVVDQILPPPGATTMYAENTMRRMDMLMFSVHGGKERSLDDWKAFFAKAHPRLRVVAYRQPRRSQLAMLELGLV